MIVSGKKLVLSYFAVMGFLGLVGLGLVIWILSLPQVERDQRFLADLLAQAVQKYRMDRGAFPKSLQEAAIDYRSENPQVLERVRKAELEWGMTSRIEGTEGATPELFIKFTKPQDLEKRYALFNRDKGQR